MTSFRSNTFLGTSLTLLLGAPLLQACSGTGSSGSCDGYDPTPKLETRSGLVTFDSLKPAIADGEVSEEECRQICSSIFYEVTGSCSVELPDGLLSSIGAGGAGNLGGAGGAGGLDGSSDDVEVTCTAVGRFLCVGRRHACWGVEWLTPRQGWFAQAAANEAGSVRSFAALASELRDTALAEFRPRLLDAAREEARHARIMIRWAERRGETRVRVRRRTLQKRTLLEIALENARSGCVEETYAALITAHQALHARDADLREDLEAIAKDEMSHASLAWDMHRAFKAALSSEEARSVDAALLSSINELTDASETGPREIGLPCATEDFVLRNRLAQHLRSML